MPTVALKPLCVAAALTGLVAIAWAHRTPPARRGAAPTPTLVCPVPPEAHASLCRVTVKSQLIRRVLSERMPLLSAAELFRQANGDDGMAGLVRGVAGRSVQEKLCYQVVRYARTAEGELRDEGHEPNGWAAELEAEFERRRATGDFPPEPVTE